MPRPPLARERVLDAFEAILIEDGERTATLEATAKAAGVSKGGLLYHFGSKDDLAAGMVQRFTGLSDEDVSRMEQAPEGPVAYYVRTSVMEDDALDRALIAVTRLAQPASEALRESRRRWAETIRPHVDDDSALDLVMLVSDGLYFNNSLLGSGDDPRRFGGFVPSDTALTRLVERVLNATTRTPPAAEPASHTE